MKAVIEAGGSHWREVYVAAAAAAAAEGASQPQWRLGARLTVECDGGCWWIEGLIDLFDDC